MNKDIKEVVIPCLIVVLFVFVPLLILSNINDVKLCEVYNTDKAQCELLK